MSDGSSEAVPALEDEASPEFALVPRGGVFEGQVAVAGLTRVEGTVRGSLQGSGKLILGPESRIEGRIECEVLSSRGEIVGPVIVRKHAHFGDGARFEGDLRAPAVEVDGDVLWNGSARVGR
jgi:cytoskeletal protein CcmA (bactofilin family)